MEFSEGCEIAPESASTLERVQNIPITRGQDCEPRGRIQQLSWGPRYCHRRPQVTIVSYFQDCSKRIVIGIYCINSPHHRLDLSVIRATKVL